MRAAGRSMGRCRVQWLAALLAVAVLVAHPTEGAAGAGKGGKAQGLGAGQGKGGKVQGLAGQRPATPAATATAVPLQTQYVQQPQ